MKCVFRSLLLLGCVSGAFLLGLALFGCAPAHALTQPPLATPQQMLPPLPFECNPIGDLRYVPKIFDCDNFSQTFMIMCLVDHNMKPGTDCWQLDIDSKPPTWSDIFFGACSVYGLCDPPQRNPGHVMNIIRVPNPSCNSNKFCIVEPQLSHNFVKYCWEQPDNEPFRLPEDLELPGFPKDRYNYTASSSCGNQDTFGNDPDPTPTLLGPQWCHQFEQATGIPLEEYYQLNCIEFSQCLPPAP